MILIIIQYCVRVKNSRWRNDCFRTSRILYVVGRSRSPLRDQSIGMLASESPPSLSLPCGPPIHTAFFFLFLFLSLSLSPFFPIPNHQRSSWNAAQEYKSIGAEFSSSPRETESEREREWKKESGCKTDIIFIRQNLCWTSIDWLSEFLESW